MHIGALAKQSGISQSSIRFYEQKGLISPALRSSSGYRIYDEKSLNRLTQIKFCKQLGFSLDDITQLLGVNAEIDHETILTTLSRRKVEVEVLLNQLTQNLNNINMLESRLSDLWEQGECMQPEELANLVRNMSL